MHFRKELLEDREQNSSYTTQLFTIVQNKVQSIKWLRLSRWAAKVFATSESKNSMYLIKSSLIGSVAQSQYTTQEQFQF